MNIDIDKLAALTRSEIHQFDLRRSHNPSREYIVVIGRDIMSQHTGVPEDQIRDVYQDLTSSSCAKIFGHPFILNGESQGVSFMPPINPITTPKREISDRERMTSAHITAVVKITAVRAAAQKGEYADGYKACLRVMCRDLGVEVPAVVCPFKGMKIEDMSDRILEEIDRHANTQT